MDKKSKRKSRSKSKSKKVAWCEDLPKDIILKIIEDQAGKHSLKNCKDVRGLCQNPKCKIHCMKPDRRTKEHLDICKEVIKTQRCFDGLKEWKIIREYLVDVIKYNQPEQLSYYHSILLRRYQESGGIYNVLIGDIKDNHLDEEIKDLESKKDLSKKDEDYLTDVRKEKKGLKLPSRAKPKLLTKSQKEKLTQMFRERNDHDNWAKYTIKQCIQLIFSKYDAPDLFKEICMFFEDKDTVDEDGNLIFTDEDVLESPDHGPPDGIMFVNGKWIKDIGESLDEKFFSKDTNINEWNDLLEEIEKEKKLTKVERERLKQQFLLMIGFLDDLLVNEMYDYMESQELTGNASGNTMDDWPSSD